MAEKLVEVYDQYDMEIEATRRGRGTVILSTSKGLHVLEPFKGNVTRLEREFVLKKVLEEGGCDFIDTFVLNKNNQLLSYDRYHQPFVMRTYFNGEECDMENENSILQTVDLLSLFHEKGQSLWKDYFESWRQHLLSKEKERALEILDAIEQGEELEKLTSLYEVKNETLVKLMEPDRSLEDEMELSTIDEKGLFLKNMVENEKRDGVRETFERHNKELKKIKKFISTVKRKNIFEDTFLRVYSEFFEKGEACVKMLAEYEIQKQQIELAFERTHYGICHGNFNQHNVILGENQDVLVHFEKFFLGNQLIDLYQFSRKVMEKNHFDFSLLRKIFEQYEKRIPMTQKDKEYILILFSYPEKFWKIANGYYNTKKGFLSPKYMEKLETVIKQETEKEKLLEEYKEKMLLFN